LLVILKETLQDALNGIDGKNLVSFSVTAKTCPEILKSKFFIKSWIIIIWLFVKNFIKVVTFRNNAKLLDNPIAWT
jgi:hypothetical protein